MNLMILYKHLGYSESDNPAVEGCGDLEIYSGGVSIMWYMECSGPEHNYICEVTQFGKCEKRSHCDKYSEIFRHNTSERNDLINKYAYSIQYPGQKSNGLTTEPRS